MEIFVHRDMYYALAHSLVTPGTSPLHLTPRVTYSDQPFHVSAEINLHNTQSDGQLRTILIFHNGNRLKTTESYTDRPPSIQ